MQSNFTKEEKLLLDSSVDFMEKCEQGILINQGPFTSSENPKISVIIPVYNASATIKKAIRSIQNQKFQDLEIIIIDDCSPDNSFNIMSEMQKTDPRIKLFRNEVNRGVLFTRSTAALKAKGKYIMYLDNDDMFSRDDKALNIVPKADFIKYVESYTNPQVSGKDFYNHFVLKKDKIKAHLKKNEEIIWTLVSKP